MKRVALLAIGAVALVALAAAAVPRLVSADLIKQRIAENLAALTGREVVLKGMPVLTIYPSLSITIGDLTIANPEGINGEPFLTAESVTARVRLAPLLFGTAQFDLIELTKPRIHLVANADGRNNWTLAAAAPNATVAPPRRVKITAGTVLYDDVAGARHEQLSEVDLDSQWPSPGSPLTGSGTLRWRGEPVEFNGQIGNPLAAASGASSALRLAVAANPIRLFFNGTVGPAISGTASLTTPALRRVIEWMGKPMGNGPTLGAASVQAKVDWMGSAVSFADARIELDGNNAVGALMLDYGGARPRIEGTLAATRLDVSPYIEALRAGSAMDPAVLLAPAAIPAPPVDADLRISADQVLAGSVRIDKAAGGLAIKNSALSLSIGEAQLYGGTLTADLSLSRFGDRLVSRASAKLADVALRPALSDLAGVQALDGAASGQVDLSAQGASWAELLQGVNGRSTVSISDGAIGGLDLADLAALAGGSPEPVVPGTGALRFTQFTGTVTLDAGIVETTDAALRGSTYSVDLKGWGSLASGLIDARATLSPSADGTARAVPIAISGTWRHPQFDVDRERTQPAGVAAPRG